MQLLNNVFAGFLEASAVGLTVPVNYQIDLQS
jgi:hypothetical protein